MKLTAKGKGAPKRDSDGTVSEKYTTEITVMYDPDVDLFYLVDSTGSTMEKLTPSEVEEQHPAVYRRFAGAVQSRNPATGAKRARTGAKRVRRNPDQKKILRNAMRGT